MQQTANNILGKIGKAFISIINLFLLVGLLGVLGYMVMGIIGLESIVFVFSFVLFPFILLGIYAFFFFENAKKIYKLLIETPWLIDFIFTIIR